MQHQCHRWWKEAVVYQVYPRSFQDSNGDGIGDLPGILTRLDYIVSLGVDAVWINPVCLSAGKDVGYDIIDFRQVQPEYGTMEDMDRLIAAVHCKGLRLIMDMVLNHTSNRHEWFQQASSSRDNPYYGYYIWWPVENGQPPARCGFFDPSGSAWTYNAPTRSWYLHYFAPEQPDLNWDLPEVRSRLYDILRFWLEKGIDGLRFDALTYISKDQSFPAITPGILKEKYNGDWGHYYAAGPHLHEYLREMHREVLAPYNVLSIAEAAGVGADEALSFVAEDRKEIDLLYPFEAIGIGYLPDSFKTPDPAGYSRGAWKEVYSRWSKVFDTEGWGALYLGNHDQPRMVSRWGEDKDPFRQPSSKLLFTFLLTMRGTPFLYNGDEFGMTNIRFTSIEDYQDVETHGRFEQLQKDGGDTAAFLTDQQLAGRDNGRTPMQWSDAPGAGFTTGDPWLKINPDHTRINRESEEKDPSSVLHFVRMLIRLRRSHPALVYGDYTLMSGNDSPVHAYMRSHRGCVLAILLNLSSEKQFFASILSAPSQGDILVDNYPGFQWSREGILLQPWQALVFACGTPSKA
ncbi:MAG TPA: alpha-glucosidase [Puia sp.]|jgi:oligo-1,6-glucosidase|nr:alpha-glucosidase [Puia sp.]